MPLTPEDIRTKEFRNSIRGYNEHEVDAFLDEVEGELTRLLRENSELRERVVAAAAASQLALANPGPTPMGETEEMLRRTLLLAQRTADETVAQAKADADRIVAEAQAHTQALIGHAQQQAAAHVTDLDARRQALEQHIEGLRAFEREYRTRLKAYLEAQLRDLDGRAGASSPPPSSAAPAIQQSAAAAAPALPPAAPAHTPAPTTPAPTTPAAPAPVASAPAYIPVVEPETSTPAGAPMTDIPGGFVRRSEPVQGDVPRVE